MQLNVIRGLGRSPSRFQLRQSTLAAPMDVYFRLWRGTFFRTRPPPGRPAAPDWAIRGRRQIDWSEPRGTVENAGSMPRDLHHDHGRIRGCA